MKQRHAQLDAQFMNGGNAHLGQEQTRRPDAPGCVRGPDEQRRTELQHQEIVVLCTGVIITKEWRARAATKGAPLKKNDAIHKTHLLLGVSTKKSLQRTRTIQSYNSNFQCLLDHTPLSTVQQNIIAHDRFPKAGQPKPLGDAAAASPPRTRQQQHGLPTNE